MDIQPLNLQLGVVLHGRDLSDFVGLPVEYILGLLRQHGCLLFRANRALTMNGFEQISNLVSQQFIKHAAKVRRKVSADGTIQTVTVGTKPIVLHAEMHFSPFSPKYLWLFCDVAPKFTGETTLCDGVVFFHHLSNQARTLLFENRLRYLNLWEAETWRSQFPEWTQEQVVQHFVQHGCTARFDQTGDLHFETIKSAFTRTDGGEWAFANSIAVHRQYLNDLAAFQAEGQESRIRHRIRFEDGREVPPWLFDEVDRLEQQLKQAVHWQDGDLLLLDNERVMHGRNPVDPQVPRQILVRMAGPSPQGSADGSAGGSASGVPAGALLVEPEPQK